MDAVAAITQPEIAYQKWIKKQLEKRYCKFVDLQKKYYVTSFKGAQNSPKLIQSAYFVGHGMSALYPLTVTLKIYEIGCLRILLQVKQVLVMISTQLVYKKWLA